jgi:putative ABC transport system permease protein
VSDLLTDLRLAARSLARNRGTSLIVVLTLALGIGANTVVFSFASGILLAPLPYPRADRLVRIETVRGGEAGPISLREIADLRARGDLFTDVAAHGKGDGGYNLSGSGRPEEVPALLCTHNLFAVLGVDLALGTPWPEEGDRLRNYSVVLGHDLWQTRWGGSPEFLAETLTLDGAGLYRVYGVAPRGFDYPSGQRLWRSLAFYDLDLEDRGARYYLGLARLRPGVTRAAAQQAVTTLAQELAASFPTTNAGVGFRLVPLAELYVGRARPYLLLLLGAVGFVLAIASANVAGLLVARAIGKSRETAVRRALGAGRWRIIRPWLVEGLLCGLAGGAVALGLGLLGARFLRTLLAVELPPWMAIGLDARVLLLTLAAALGAGLATAAVPAWHASGGRLSAALGASARGATEGRGRRSARGALVVVQVVTTAVLLVGAGLTVKSFRALARADLGFRPEGLLTLRVNLGWRAYDDDEKIRRYFRQLLDRLAALPGVAGVATDSNPPLGGVVDRPTVTLEGQSPDEQRRSPYVNRKIVSPGYFALMGIDLLAGRVFDERDAPQDPPVVVVSRRAAAALWPGGRPLGRRLKFGAADSAWPWLEVVGVVDDVHQERVGAGPGLDVYADLFQLPDLNAFVLLRTEVAPETLAAAANEAALAIDPDQATWEPAAMERRVAASLWQPRLAGTLCALFAVLASLLAAVGIYGVLAHAVRERRRDLGVRRALGAPAAQVLRAVLADTLRRLAAGLALGLPMAWALARLVRGLLYETSAADPVVFLAAAAGLVAVALVAAWAPARQALRVDPVAALREE